MQKPIFLLALLLTTAGCASNAPVRTPDATLPAAFESADAATAAAPLDRWWLAFNDPQLTALVEEALANAPEAELAVARLEEARATRLANIRSAFPQGALIGNLSQRGTEQVSGPQNTFQSSDSTTSATLGFDVSWELDVWGKTRTSRRAVENDFAAKVFNIEGSRAALAASVGDALFSARALMQQWRDAQETARIARETQRIAEVRAQRGLSPDSDVRRASADVRQADAAVLQLGAELDAARRSLLVLLGRGTAPLDSLQITASEADPPLPPGAVPGEILQRRPDVREAQERLALAIAQLRIDRLNLFPKFTLMPGIGLTRAESANFDPSTGGISFEPSITADWSIGLGVNVPVLNRPQLLATARASGARAEQAVINYEAVVQRAYGEADSALLQLAADRARLDQLELAEADARAAFEAAQVRYRAGLDDQTVLLSAEQGWRAARQQAVAARSQAQRRAIQVFKALGGGWTPGDDFKV